jgi:large subunit ribosomal protein L21
MYAIVETGGKQYRVKPGDTIAVERITGAPGDILDLGRVLLVGGNGDGTRVGLPGVDGAVVRAEVVEHARGEKIIVFRYKSKVRYRRKTGHRQALTRLRITDILVDGASAVAAAEAPASEEAAAPARGRRAATAAVVDEPVPTESASTQAATPSSAGEAGPAPEEESTATETETKQEAE